MSHQVPRPTKPSKKADANKKKMNLQSFRKKLLEHLDNSGFVGHLRAEIRSELAKSLRFQSSNAQNTPPSLQTRLIYGLVAQFLQQKNLRYSLSVFLAEIGGPTIQPLSPPDITSLLNFGTGSSGLLETIVKEISDQASRESTGVQTAICGEDCIPTTASLDEKLRQIDESFARKAVSAEPTPRDESLESRFMQYKHRIDQQNKRVLQKELNEMKEYELSHIRASERALYQSKIDKLRLEFDTMYTNRLASLVKREEELIGRVRNKEMHLEQMHFEQRQFLLSEMDRLKSERVYMQRTSNLDMKENMLEQQRLKQREHATMNEQRELKSDVGRSKYEARMQADNELRDYKLLVQEQEAELSRRISEFEEKSRPVNSYVDQIEDLKRDNVQLRSSCSELMERFEEIQSSFLNTNQRLSDQIEEQHEELCRLRDASEESPELDSKLQEIHEQLMTSLSREEVLQSEVDDLRVRLSSTEREKQHMNEIVSAMQSDQSESVPHNPRDSCESLFRSVPPSQTQHVRESPHSSVPLLEAQSITRRSHHEIDVESEWTSGYSRPATCRSEPELARSPKRRERLREMRQRHARIDASLQSRLRAQANLEVETHQIVQDAKQFLREEKVEMPPVQQRPISHIQRSVPSSRVSSVPSPERGRIVPIAPLPVSRLRRSEKLLQQMDELAKERRELTQSVRDSFVKKTPEPMTPPRVVTLDVVPSPERLDSKPKLTLSVEQGVSNSSFTPRTPPPNDLVPSDVDVLTSSAVSESPQETVLKGHAKHEFDGNSVQFTPQASEVVEAKSQTDIVITDENVTVGDAKQDISEDDVATEVSTEVPMAGLALMEAGGVSMTENETKPNSTTEQVRTLISNVQSEEEVPISKEISPVTTEKQRREALEKTLLDANDESSSQFQKNFLANYRGQLILEQQNDSSDSDALSLGSSVDL